MKTLQVKCAGECGDSFELVEPPTDRPIARLAVGLLGYFDMTAKGWEFRNRKWFCGGCVKRRRLVRALPS